MRAIFTRIRVGSIRSVITPLLLGLLQASGLSAQPCKEIVGYYPNWQWYDRNKAVRPQTIAYKKYTVLNYCFFRLKFILFVFFFLRWWINKSKVYISML